MLHNPGGNLASPQTPDRKLKAVVVKYLALASVSPTAAADSRATETLLESSVKTLDSSPDRLRLEAQI
jgi:hypothetical protein